MKTKRRWDLLAVALVVALAIALWPGAAALQVWRHATSLRTTLQQLERRAEPQALRALDADSIAGLRADVARLEADLQAIQESAGPLLAVAGHLGWVPRWGGDLQASPALLEIANGSARAARLLLDAAQPGLLAWSDAEGQGGPTLAERLLGIVQGAEPQLREADQELARVGARRTEVDAAALSPSLAGQVERLDRYLPALRLAVSGSLQAPELLGADRPRTYLVLAQNSDELRGAGGFISGVGVLRLEAGRLTEQSFQDSYSVDDLSQLHPAPPAALQKYMLADIWLLRDANWSPDFPTSAQAAANLYALDQKIVVDGVIAVDITAIRWLVGALGPLTVEGAQSPITEANLVQFMKESWAAPPGGATIAERQTSDWWQHRKDFMGLLVTAALRKIESGSDLDAAALLQALSRSVREKHLLMHFNDAEVERLLGELGWDGSVAPGDGDYLMVVDSNVGFNKVNPRIEQSIEYRLTLTDSGTPQAELTLRYRHTASIRLEQCVHEARYGDTYDDMMERCYFDYVRVHAPAGSSLREADGFESGTVETLPGEGDTQVFGGYLVLAPGEEREIRLRYDLPADLLTSGVYHLRVQKQAGTSGIPLRLSLTGLVEASCETDLTSDRQFSLTLDRAEGQRGDLCSGTGS